MCPGYSEVRRVCVRSTGGARIGWINATWPFATLTAQQEQLVLNATLLGKYSFAPEQVVEIEQYMALPILGWGIRIHHNIPTYPRKIIFWCLGSPASLIERIRETGFTPKASPDSVPVNRGIPVRWQALVVMGVLWNALLLLDTYRAGGTAGKPGGKPGVLMLIALLLLFAGSVTIWWSRFLQRLILKPERSSTEIKAWLYLLALVSGMMLIFMFDWGFVGHHH